MSRLILVRHGESVGNRERIFASSPQELPLTDLGYAQAHSAAQRIAELFRPALVVTSPYLRASETARVIATELAIPMAVESQLHERDFGNHRGLSYDSLLVAPGYDATRPWAYKPQGGESYQDVRTRVGLIMDRLADAHSNQEIVVVSHGGVMVALWAYVTGEWATAYAPPNCGIVLIEGGPQAYSKPRIIDAARSVSDAGG